MKAYSKLTTLITTLFLLTQPVLAHIKVGVTQIVEHPSLNKIRDGLVETIRKKDPNAEIIYENAQGNPAIATQIAQKFAGMDLDVIIPISTPSAQAIVGNIKSVPVVFAAISDPIEAKLVDSLERPGGNLTGVMDSPPLAEQLNLMLKVVPNLNRVGIVYNPGEANSVSMLKSFTELARRMGVEVVPSTAAKSGDVSTASYALVDKVDAILIGNDNTVVSGLEALVKVCNQNQIPLFTSDPDSVKRGAYAAVAYNQKDLGVKAGELVLRILAGEKVGGIPVAKPDKFSFTFNKETAKNLQLPNSIKGGL